ncbi:MAG: SulP family inorganic anion transporter [Solirubrobacterales bacterium]
MLPSGSDYEGVRSFWRSDVLAGASVGVVALPLALAFSIAAGLGPEAGIITAVVAGIVAAIFGGSSVQVSGPTGAMAVVLAPVVAHSGVGAVAFVTLAAGLLLVAAGAGRLGRFVGFLPWPVIEGFTVGIGLIIFLQQVPAMLGVPAGEAENVALRAAQSVLDIGSMRWEAVATALLVVLVMTVTPRIHRSFPASLAGVLVATVAVQAFSWDIAAIGALPTSLPAPGIPGVPLGDLPQLLTAVLAIAALAGVESLLSARVADGLSDGTPHDPDRELFGQGVANVAVSFFGGMPATGAIARTAVNVRAGARTRVSAAVHGLVVLSAVAVFSPWIAKIPLAALAGVLMVTAFHMVEFGTATQMLRSTRGDALVFGVTAAATVALDLIAAIEIGVVLAGLIALRSVVDTSDFRRDDLSGESIDTQTEHDLLGEHVVAYRLDGALFFGATRRFLLELTEVSDVDVVILRCGTLRVLDASGAQAIGELVTQLQDRGISVLLACLRPEHRRLIEDVGALSALEHEDRIVATIDEAISWAKNFHRARAGDSLVAATA